jgi:hypothetical protein
MRLLWTLRGCTRGARTVARISSSGRDGLLLMAENCGSSGEKRRRKDALPESSVTTLISSSTEGTWASAARPPASAAKTMTRPAIRRNNALGKRSGSTPTPG